MRNHNFAGQIPKRIISALAISAMALSFVACATDAPSSSPTDGASASGSDAIKVGRNAGGFEGVIFADTEGFFADNGIEATVSLGGDPTSQIAALVSGETDIAMTGGPDIVRAVAQGIPVKVIAGAKAADPNGGGEATDGLLLPPGSSIKTWADLKGKTVGIQGLGSLPQVVNTIALKKNGVDPNSVKYVNLPVDTLADAAKNGTVDAILPYSVFFLNAVDSGFTRMGDGAREFLPGAPQIVWAASDKFIAEHGDVIKRFTKAMDEGNQFAADNPDAVKDVYRNNSKLPEPFIANRMVLEPLSVKLNRDTWNTMIKTMAELKFIDKAIPATDVIIKSAP